MVDRDTSVLAPILAVRAHVVNEDLTGASVLGFLGAKADDDFMMRQRIEVPVHPLAFGLGDLASDAMMRIAAITDQRT